MSHAGLVVQDVAAIAAFESTASSDGLDDAELERLTELVAVAQQRVGEATKTATAIAEAKEALAAASDSDEKASLGARVKSLRATYKAHRKTSASLRALAKELAS